MLEYVFSDDNNKLIISSEIDEDTLIITIEDKVDNETSISLGLSSSDVNELIRVLKEILKKPQS